MYSEVEQYYLISILENNTSANYTSIVINRQGQLKTYNNYNNTLS